MCTALTFITRLNEDILSIVTYVTVVYCDVCNKNEMIQRILALILQIFKYFVLVRDGIYLYFKNLRTITLVAAKGLCLIPKLFLCKGTWGTDVTEIKPKQKKLFK